MSSQARVTISYETLASADGGKLMLPSTQESLAQGLFSIVKSRAQDITSLFGYSGERKPKIWQVTAINVYQRSFPKNEKEGQ